MKTRRICAVDMFCGAGGTSTGLALACRDAGIQIDLLAINHWQIAIDTHVTLAKSLCGALVADYAPQKQRRAAFAAD